ncbi:MAG: biopolymer transporter ExbD [Verrucomicrobia bacterium]|nr:biopolymer transporter ExbD [Verrucomicrobiota bacterium]
MPVKLQSQSSDDEGDEARIEIIPLIDIMFFLLAAFMLVSLSMTHVRRVPINLPTASSAQEETTTPPIQIAIDAEGVTTWDSKVVTLSEITTRLKSADAGGETRVMISADADTRHRQVVGVLDAVKAAGVEKVGIETREVKN